MAINVLRRNEAVDGAISVVNPSPPADPFLTIASYGQPLPHLYQKLSGLSCLNNLPILLTSLPTLFTLTLLTSLPTFTYPTDIIAHFSIDHTTIFPPALGPLHGSRANTERLLIVIVKAQ
jgi:hypothetical protein